MVLFPRFYKHFAPTELGNPVVLPMTQIGAGIDITQREWSAVL
jgi:hypothetical protein